MVPLLRLAACACAALVSGPPARTADTAPEHLVRDLGSPLFSVREKASSALWRLGEKARPALLLALRSDDPEVGERAQQILDKFDAGIFPDTPPDVLRQIDLFRSGSPENQQKAVAALVRLGGPAAPTLRALLTKSVAAAARRPIFDHLSGVLRQEVPRLLVAGKPDEAEALLALTALGPAQHGSLDYAVFLKLRSRTKEAIADLEAARAAGGTTGEAAAQALAFVYRAAGDGPRAVAAAKVVAARPGDPNEVDERGPPPHRRPYESLLEDLGQWGELADQPVVRANSEPGLRAFRLRQAGRDKEADDVLADQKAADFTPAESARSGPVDEPTLALMANGRPLDGIDRLRTNRNAPHILADVLSVRMEFQAALDLLGGGAKADEGSEPDAATLRQLYGTRRGRLLAQLGQRDAAAQVFEQVAAQITPGNGAAITQLVRYEVRSGRAGPACEHLGKYLAAVARNEGRFHPMAGGRDAFEELFEADADAARYWWETLYAHRATGEAPGKIMRRVRDLLTGKATRADLDAALAAARKQDVAPGKDPEAEAKALAVAAALRANGKAAEAGAELARHADKVGNPAAGPTAEAEADAAARPSTRTSRWWVFGIDERFRFWVELGDLLTEQGKHAEAAARLEQGWKWYPDNPVLLYLSGRALIAAGDEKEGARRMELAHWVALGNARVRGRFLEELIDRGDTAAARQERGLVYDSAWLFDQYLGNVWNQVARASAALKDFPAAAAAHRRAIHYLLQMQGVTYVEGYAYLTVPQSVRANDARGLIAAGKVDEGLALIRECLTVMPGNSDVAIGVVPELEKLGRAADAEAVFRRVWGAYAAMLKDHPDSAWAMASAAWLAAGCRRELDSAAKYAERAVELEPELRSHREALAEVHFRRGDREKAVAIMKDLAAAHRHSHHYKRQLDRYQTAAFDSPLPGTED